MFLFYIVSSTCQQNNNLLLTEREGRTAEYWPKVAAVRIERSEVRTNTTEGQYSPVRLELARLVSSLLYGTRAMLVLNLPAFKSKRYAAYDRFHGNGMAESRSRMDQSERSDLPCHITMYNKMNWSGIFLHYFL